MKGTGCSAISEKRKVVASSDPPTARAGKYQSTGVQDGFHDSDPHSCAGISRPDQESVTVSAGTRERIFVELMTSDRKLKASREGAK